MRPQQHTEPTRARPLVKWAGGKGRLLSALGPLLPDDLASRRYIEPFAGGAALFFSVASRGAVLNDMNPDLMHLYRAVRDDVETLVQELELLATRHSEQHYYQLRAEFNRCRGEQSVAQAARFVCLNRTCYNGLFRVNQQGQFNVSAGRYRNPRICDAANLRAASLRLQGCELRHGDFEGLDSLVRAGDFLYLDPPYVPVSASANFTSYTETGFTAGDQERLAAWAKSLDERGCRWMLSNSDTSTVRQLYQGMTVDVVRARRSINSSPHKRAPVCELVVRNYQNRQETSERARWDLAQFLEAAELEPEATGGPGAHQGENGGGA